MTLWPILRSIAPARLLLALALLSASPCAWAQSPPPDLAFDQRLGASLPLDDAFLDQAARPVKLGTYFTRRPVILVLGYYHCPMLCSTVMDGILESLRGIGVDYEVVAASIDPGESPADAARKYAAYRGLMEPGRDARLHLLTGKAAPVADLARAAGFPYRRDDKTGQYGHPAGFLIVTPDGHISRYFPGVRFAARDVRLALVEASSGRVGSLADRLVLLCSHYDPRSGKYNVAAMALARTAGLGTLAGLLATILIAGRRRRSGR